MKLLQGILVMSIPLLLLQCSKENEVEVEPVAEEEPAANIITDPFYADLNDKSTLLDYWELFVKDAIRSGKPDPGAGDRKSVV